VPGEPWRALVLAKLPVRVPSEPLTAARLEAVERERGNSFGDFMLPHAARRLKQGLGRLIRSRCDRGGGVLLDRRALEETDARLDAGEREGGNSFRDFMLPHAALRLKQGFGRLIRSRGDRGVVVPLDRRVMEKTYGRYLLESLPPAPLRVGRWGELREDVRRFYAMRAEEWPVEA